MSNRISDKIEVVDQPYLETEVEQMISLVIPRSDRFHEIADNLSEFIKGLPLNAEQNNQLVKTVMELTSEAEEQGARVGFEVGSGFVADEMGLEL